MPNIILFALALASSFDYRSLVLCEWRICKAFVSYTDIFNSTSRFPIHRTNSEPKWQNLTRLRHHICEPIPNIAVLKCPYMCSIYTSNVAHGTHACDDIIVLFSPYIHVVWMTKSRIHIIRRKFDENLIVNSWNCAWCTERWICESVSTMKIPMQFLSRHLDEFVFVSFSLELTISSNLLKQESPDAQCRSIAIVGHSNFFPSDHFLYRMPIVGKDRVKERGG